MELPEDLTVLSIPLEERMKRVREAIAILKTVNIPYMQKGFDRKYAMSRTLVFLFENAYDGLPLSVNTNSTLFRALQEEPKVVEILGPLLNLQPHQLRYIRRSH